MNHIDCNCPFLLVIKVASPLLTSSGNINTILPGLNYIKNLKAYENQLYS